MFPQMAAPELAAQGWEPQFVDYLLPRRSGAQQQAPRHRNNPGRGPNARTCQPPKRSCTGRSRQL